MEAEIEPPNSQLPTDELRILIQEELWDSGKNDFIEGIKLEAQQQIAKQIAGLKEYWEEMNSLNLIQDFRIDLEAKLKELADRLEAVEDSLEVVLSHSPSDSPEGREDTRSPEQLDSYLKNFGHLFDVRLDAFQEEINSLRQAENLMREKLVNFQSLKLDIEWLSNRLEAVEEKVVLSDLPSNSLAQDQGTRSPIQLPPEEAPGVEGEDGSMPSEELPSDSPETLNLSQLARHLKISKSVISRRKEQSNFEEWSKGRDPTGIGWRCVKKGESIKFFPVVRP